MRHTRAASFFLVAVLSASSVAASSIDNSSNGNTAAVKVTSVGVSAAQGQVRVEIEGGNVCPSYSQPYGTIHESIPAHEKLLTIITSAYLAGRTVKIYYEWDSAGAGACWIKRVYMPGT